MPSTDRKVFFEDYKFHVSDEVYEPAEDSFVFAENLSVRKGDIALDMGTGCGILGIVAACRAKEVIAVDISPYAVQCAKENAQLNHVIGKMLLVRGNLFEPLRLQQRFELILFNAPYLPTDSKDGSWIERAWTGGVDGRQVIDRFICHVPRYLKKNGRVLLMQSTLSGVEETLKWFRRSGLEAGIIVKWDLPFFETLVLLEAKRLD